LARGDQRGYPLRCRGTAYHQVKDAVRNAPWFAIVIHRIGPSWISRKFQDRQGITASDATWAIEKAKEALSGVKALLAASPPERFS
jgi:hypothetical protein